MIQRDVVENSIRGYEDQFRTLEARLRQFDADYNQQRGEMVNTLNQIHGATVALQQLLNTTAEVPVPGPPAPPVDEPSTAPAETLDADVVRGSF